MNTLSDKSDYQKQVAGFITFPVMITLAGSMFVGGAFMTRQEAEPVFPTVIDIPTEETTFEAQEIDIPNDEILWFARAIYSETKRYDEQVLVAWVIRNRVDSQYRGDDYESVVRSRSQFSGLGPDDLNYHYNISKGEHSTNESWINAVQVAKSVYDAPSALRPFSEDVMHFYSPISVRTTPSWAEGKEPVITVKDTKNGGIRFAFFEGV